jgi:TolA-binding protein
MDLWHRVTRPKPLLLSKSAGVGLAAVAIVLLLAGVELFLAERIRDLRDQTNQLQRQIASVEQRVGRLELQMEQQLSRRVPDVSAGSGRSEGEPVAAVVAKPDTSIALTRAEVDIIREYIKLPPAAAGAVATMAVGAPVGNHVLVPFPAQITDRVPKLVGARFATDKNGAIVVVAGGSDRIGFIIPPN